MFCDKLFLGELFMLENLKEYCSTGKSTVDRANNVIRGVKILGAASRNGREYLPEALAKAASLYEGTR